MYKILFATDYSARDRQAFELACVIAKVWQAKLLIAHVEDSSSGTRDHPAPVDHLERKLYDIVPSDLGIAYDYFLRRGNVASVIRELEQENDVDLIVMGTHARQGMERIFAGSVAEKVIRAAKVPVITVRDSGQPVAAWISQPVRKVLVATDFSAHSYAAMDFASLLANSLDAVLTILYVDDSNESQDRRAATALPTSTEHRKHLWQQLRKVVPTDPRVVFNHKLFDGPAADCVANYADEHHCDLIVLGTHGRTGVGRVLMGSVAEQIVRKAKCPVVTVKPNNKRHPVIHETGLRTER